MNVCTCFLLFALFAYTNAVSRIKTRNDHADVNARSDSVSEYSIVEYSKDTHNLDNAQHYKTRGTTVTDKHNSLRPVDTAPRKTFTRFLQDVVNTLNTYEDIAFEDFFHILDQEIRKYHYAGCKFSELTQNLDTRRLLAGAFRLIRGKSISFTKAQVNEMADMIRDETYDNNVKEMLDYINSLYRNSDHKFRRVLHDLNQFRNTKSIKAHNNLERVIKSGVRDILFNHYTELNKVTRRKLKERIEIFWERFKKVPTSRAKTNNNSNIEAVGKSDIGRIIELQNIMNEDQENDDYFNDLLWKNKSVTMYSLETNEELSQDKEIEKHEIGNESAQQTIDEISSGQSLDSSSNSIKNSQERHQEYNTERYMTLYTEDIYYEYTTKKTKRISMSNDITSKLIAGRRPMTTSTVTHGLRNDSSDRKKKIKKQRIKKNTSFYSNQKAVSGLRIGVKHKPRTKLNVNRQRKQGKPNLRSRSNHKNAKIISKYDAVIDVQLANTELLKSLRILDPVWMETKYYDTTLYPRSVKKIKSVPTKPVMRHRAMQELVEAKLQTSTAPTKPQSRNQSHSRSEAFYRKQLSELKKNVAASNKELPAVKFMIRNKLKQSSLTRRSDNDKIETKTFNAYVIKRMDDLENKLKELEKINDYRIKMDDHNTDVVKDRDITDEYEPKAKKLNKRKDLNGKSIEKFANNNHVWNTDNNTTEKTVAHSFTTRMNTESTTKSTTSFKPTVLKKSATVIINKNTTVVANNKEIDTKTDTEEVNKQVINDNVTTSIVSSDNVTSAMELESVVTTVTSVRTRRTTAYSAPSYYDQGGDGQGGDGQGDQGGGLTYQDELDHERIDPFEHIKDGLDVI